MESNCCARKVLISICLSLKGSYLLRAANAVETDAFCMVVVQGFKCVAVEGGNDGAGEICRDSGVGEKDYRGVQPKQ